ncbi:hypothetical protein O181_075786 [Austropuccinia psidii MF-1]|uniref:Uncharacterized protein n=1 Tax=Austropuccinia psidii MF-1 TaxID=1389203 RepID=A0A9Q3F961_9BASI|nr:hypothetical protein [Austropuccinia psidii MF-1]
MKPVQHRRVAARVGDDMGVRVGDALGDSSPFEYCNSQKTAIEYMPDGMLLRDIMTKPDLAGYAAMMIDASHEHTGSSDILLGLLNDLAPLLPGFWLRICNLAVQKGLESEKGKHRKTHEDHINLKNAERLIKTTTLPEIRKESNELEELQKRLTKLTTIKDLPTPSLSFGPIRVETKLKQRIL